MNSAIFKPKRIFVENAVRDSVLVANVLASRPQAEVVYVDDPDAIDLTAPAGENPVTFSKKQVILRRHKGSFFKKCPGMHGMMCCNYYIVNWANNCHLDCTYCFLQSYLNKPVTTIYANIEDMLAELDTIFSQNPDVNYRVGTGEYADSLAWDDMTGLSDILVPFFARYPNALLELKTKSDNIERLMHLDPHGRTLISWSANPPRIIREEEHKTADLEQRLAAAKACVEKGYKITFHFDPMIYYPGWETEYKYVVDRIFDTIPSNQIGWISIGSFRYHSSLKSIVRHRFPKSAIFYGEHVPSDDDKMRYFKPIRVQMYRQMREWLAEKDPTVFNYLCMETRDVWEKVYGYVPSCEVNLDQMFDNRGMLFGKSACCG